MTELQALVGVKAKLDRIFLSKDRYDCHDRAKPLLAAMAQDRSILNEVICQNLTKPDFFAQKRINPVIALPLFDSPDYTLVANCWLPLPDRSTQITHQSIHHHGNLLLTSVSAFGCGYESILFKRVNDYLKASDDDVVALEPDKYYRNPLHNIEFIDAYSPHVVFFPNQVSVTYALWSANRPQVAKGLKNLPFVRKHRSKIKRALKALGLTSVAGTNVVENFDYYAKDGQIRQLKNRVTYPAGTVDHFVPNFFYLLQEIGFDQNDLLEQYVRNPSLPHRALVSRCYELFKRGEKITDTYEPSHLNIPKMQIERAEILKCFPGLRLETKASASSSLQNPTPTRPAFLES